MPPSDHKTSEVTQSAPYLEPGRLGTLTLKNRLIRAATSESMAGPQGEPSAGHSKLYGDLAEGGAGLLITGHLFVEPRGQYSLQQGGLHDDAVIPAWRATTDRVHIFGGRIFAELAHAGSQSVVPWVTPIAPSVVPNAIFTREPREMSEDDIADVIAAFGAAAKRAKVAGFDGVHLHGGNGYLISEFGSPHANKRTDRWGGDAEGRARFTLEVYKAVRSAVGPDFPVGARIGMADSAPHGLTLEEGVERVAQLEALGLDAVEVTLGVMSSYLQNIRPYVGVTPGRALADGLFLRLFSPVVPEAYYRPYAAAVKRRCKLPVILVGGIRTTKTMSDVLTSGDADFLALARPFIREPDLAAQLTQGRQGLVDCVSCNICLGYEGRESLRCWRKSPRLLAQHAYNRFWLNRHRKHT